MLRRTEIEVDPSSYVDPQGFLFHHSGEIYRCIRSNAKPLFSALLDKGVLNRLEREFGLIASEPTSLRLEGDTEGLILKHPEVWPLTFCAEWSPAMLWEAARLTLDLAIELSGKNLILQDAYPWNILFDGASPVFVDLTSIAHPTSGLLWPAHEQYESYFWRPLVLMKEGKGAAARALLSNNISGLDLETFAGLVSSATRVRYPGIVLGRAMERRLQASASLKRRTQALAQRSPTEVTGEIRTRYLKRQRTKLDPLRHRPKGDCWTNYYAEIDPGVDKQAKLNIVSSLLDQCAGASVLDLGCNTGVFAAEAAKQGARVVAIDASESCIDLLFETARSRSLCITPLVADIACPVSTAGFLGRQYAPLFDRVKCDTVMCLGLMHHLHISARQSFERIAGLMDHVCGATLIFEYVGLDDANIALLSATNRKFEYTLGSVTASLGAYFTSIVVHDSDRPTRKILLCRK